MGIQVGDNFDHKSKKPLDNRTSYATLAAMKAVTDANIPEGCFAYCEETDKYYKFLSTNTVDADTGKWREFEAGGEDPNAYHTTDTAETTLADSDKFPFYDASANATKHSTWSNIKAKLKTYFDTLYNKVTAGTGLSLSGNVMSIKPFESGDMDEVIPELPQGNTLVSIANAFNKGDIYSTSEKMIGQWTDGNPLYQKTINFGALPNNTTKTVAHGISNLANIIDIKGWFNENTVWGGLSYASSYDNATNGVEVYVSGANVAVRTVKDQSSYTTCYITLQYTKTTDSAIAIGEETEYSTSEKIVGTWIDGKPIYQKTVSGTFPSTTSGTYATNDIATISNVDKVISQQGFYLTGNTYVTLPWIAGSGYISKVTYEKNRNTVTLSTNNGAVAGITAYVTIQYTKA